MSRRPGKPIDVAREGGKVEIPSEGMLVERSVRLAGARAAIQGLLAVGVPLREALPSYAKGLDVSEIIALSIELEPMGIERMRALYEVQKDLKNKKEFGALCMKAGIHPLGIALTAIRKEEEEGLELDGKSIKEAKGLVRAFGVDEWAEAGVGVDGYALLIGEADLASLPASSLVIPCDVVINAPDERVIDCLVEVGGNLQMERVYGTEFPNLVAVGESLEVYGSKSLAFPSLKTIGQSLFAEKTQGISLPVLESIGGEVMSTGAIDLKAPSLRSVFGEPYPQVRK